MSSWRPEFPPIVLDDDELAKVGFIAVTDARAKATLITCLKAIQGKDNEFVKTNNLKPTRWILKNISKTISSLSHDTVDVYKYIEEIHPFVQLLRNRAVHGVWAQTNTDQKMVLDPADGSAFPLEHLQDTVGFWSHYCDLCHRFSIEIGRDIVRGKISPHEYQVGGMRMMIDGEMVAF